MIQYDLVIIARGQRRVSYSVLARDVSVVVDQQRATARKLARSGAKVYGKLADDELNLIASNLRAHGSARPPTALRPHRGDVHVHAGRRRRAPTARWGARARRRRFPGAVRYVMARSRAAGQAGRRVRLRV
jgi:hypothetical protein